jgi:hypothetical protein
MVEQGFCHDFARFGRLSCVKDRGEAEGMGPMTPTRRGVMLAVTGGLAAAGVPRARAAGAPEAALLLCPGPEDGAAAAFARQAAAGLARGMVRAASLRVAVLGGPDGITAANRFATTVSLEDRVLLLVPGLAGQAQLVGDSRARFEARAWPAVCASLMPAALVGRLPEGGAPIRVAIPGPAAPEAAALLALELLGRRTVPIFPAPGQAPAALVATGAADAMVFCGGGIAARAASLGLQPWFAFDGAAGGRDPALPDLPGFGELLSDPGHPLLVEGVRAAGAALRSRGVLVLPALTPADTVAIWRGAARAWAEAEPEVSEPGTRRVLNGEATALAAALFPAPEVALAYREWLLRRMNWRAA